MLQALGVSDDQVAGWARRGWGVDVSAVRFLPLGYDRDAWAYEVRAGAGERYFLKVRRGPVTPAAVLVPRYLRGRGLRQVVAPLDTDTAGGDPRYRVDGYEVLLYPFVSAGQAADRGLTEAQWAEYGAFVGAMHRLDLPPDVAASVPEETYASPAPAVVRSMADHVRRGRFVDPVQRELAGFWRAHDDRIAELADRVERLAELTRAARLPHVPCHADIHGWNVLVDDDDGRLHVVNWDCPMLAPAERDLAFVVRGALGWTPVTERQEALFRRGYGPVEVDPVALAYYRYLRVAEDVGEFARGVFLRDDLGEAAKADEVETFLRQFAPDGPLDRARRADPDPA